MNKNVIVTLTIVFLVIGITIVKGMLGVPYSIYGYVYKSDGVTPQPGASVNITNLNTGESIPAQSLTGSRGSFVQNLANLRKGYKQGDNLKIEANYLNYIGTMTTAIGTKSPQNLGVIVLYLPSEHETIKQETKPEAILNMSIVSCVDNTERLCGSNVGVCEHGIMTCINGSWGDCTGRIEPSPEICDGLDDDCDSVIDEDCECIPGITRPCGSNIGECKAGTRSCIGGFWSDCVGGIKPSQEVCDGLDNDCNSVIDDKCSYMVTGMFTGIVSRLRGF